MKTEVKKLGTNVVEVNIEIEEKNAEKEYEKACKRIAQNVNIAGFRKGKAPRNIVEKYVGVDSIRREALDSMLPRVFTDIIKENQYELITEPTLMSFDFEKGKPCKVVAKFELRPEVKISAYKGLTVETEEYKNEDGALDKELEKLSDRYAEFVKVEGRKTTDKDVVMIDFEGSVGDELIKGGAAKNYMLDLANSTFIPGFAEQLVDKEVGKEFTIDVKFPEEYHDEKLKGADAKFKITINEIKEKKLPEINDEFAKKVNSKFETLDALKEDIQKFADNTAKAENEKRTAAKIFEILIEKTPINVQDSMINREVRALMEEFKQRINMQGGNFDKMLEQEGHQKVYEQMKEEALKRIKTSLIVGKIAQNENLTVTQDDIQSKIVDLANIYRTSADNIIAEIRKNVNLLHSINQQIITEKVTRILIDNAKVSYKK